MAISTPATSSAPPDGRSQVLGIWRLCADSGNAFGPLLVSVLAGLGSLAAGIVTMGGVGFAAAAALLRWVPRYSRWAHPGTIARHAADQTQPDHPLNAQRR